MNNKQIRNATFGLSLIALCAFFPPLKPNIPPGMRADYSLFLPGCILDPGIDGGGSTCIDTDRLIAICLFIAALTGIRVLNPSSLRFSDVTLSSSSPSRDSGFDGSH